MCIRTSDLCQDLRKYLRHLGGKKNIPGGQAGGLDDLMKDVLVSAG